jgi:hypothetical protein
VEWIDLVQDAQKWLALGDVEMKLRFPEIAGNLIIT